MAISALDKKDQKPTKEMLQEAIGDSYPYWLELEKYVCEKYREAEERWNFAGKKYGGGFRLKDKKRGIVYFIPCNIYFKNGFVLGEKATRAALDCNISDKIREIINSAPVNGEGRGFRIDFKEKNRLVDIKNVD